MPNREMYLKFALLVVTLSSFISFTKADLFPISIIHINDFHARFEPTDATGSTCKAGDLCIGGYARTVYTVKRLLNAQKDYNPIYLNAGDSFQGTLWYNIGRWNVTQQLLNMLPADAMTLGNHEMDHSIEGLVPFLDHINTTMLVANMDAMNEPTMQGKYEDSTIIVRSNRKIGLIGVILETTYELANTGKLIFRNESDAIRREAAKLMEQGANIIIVISHCGYEVDKLIAAKAGDVIDVIVGAHSHTFLYTGTPPGPDKAYGDYPTEVVHSSGHRVLIVQAAAYAKYVGNITVYFDDNGNVVSYEGAPIYMSNDVPEDPGVVAALQPWKEVIDEKGNVVIGNTKVDLTKDQCSSNECNLGNFFCDAMVHTFTGLTSYDDPKWSHVTVGLVGTGSLRVPLPRGNLTYAQMITMSPFENVLVAFNLPGKYLLEALEFGVSKIDLANNKSTSHIFLQVSGLKVTYDFTRPEMARVVSLRVRCSDCMVPRYEDFDSSKIYRIVAPEYLRNGGDGYSMIYEHSTDLKISVTDIDSLLSFSDHNNPIYTGVEGRITVLK